MSARPPKLSPEETSGTSSLRRTLQRVERLRPSRDDVVDGAFTAVLAGLALFGLHTSFSGWTFLVVGIVGCLLGIVTAHVARVLDAPLILLFAGTFLMLFLLGPVLALRSTPVPSTLADLLHQLLFGWKDLLTTLPPVDGRGPLLVLPYALGLAAGTIAQSLATRSRREWPPPLVLVCLLCVTILIGSEEPPSLVFQGVVFAVLSILWLSLRGSRNLEPIANGSGRWWRLSAGAAVVVLAALVAVPLGADALASGSPRVVLRDRVQPPFDVGKYPSPLAGFRRYTKPNSPQTRTSRLYDKDLFTVSDAPPGALLRIATLDAYDDRTWGAANSGGSPGQVDDTFQRVSSTIDNPLASGGPTTSMHVTVGEGYEGVWLPTVGAVTGVRFDKDVDPQASEMWRYNLATSTAVVPTGLVPGDGYTMTAGVPSSALSPGDGAYGDVTVQVPEGFESQASDWGQTGGADPLKQVMAIAAHLHDEGGYTDGEAPFQRYTAGHYVGRLAQFVGGDQIAGDDEQFAATMALLANQVGVPARVVLGAKIPDNGVVRGKDVHAWVELRVADGTWRTLPTDQFMDRNHPPDPHPPQIDAKYSGAVVPPPAPVPPASTVADPADGELDQKVTRRHGDDGSGTGLPGWLRAALLSVGLPTLVVGLVCGGIVLLKSRRRRRRRTSAAPTRQISGGWTEVLDRARDLGVDLPGSTATRSEQADALAVGDAHVLARAADDHVFGPGQPSPQAVSAYWHAVDVLCAELGRRVGLLRRLVAAVNPATLLPRRGAASHGGAGL